MAELELPAGYAGIGLGVVKFAKGTGLTGSTYELNDDSRIVTRQQLRDPNFYAQVRLGVLNGSVQVIDQSADSLEIGGETLSLMDQSALEALADSQASWIGQPDAHPFLTSLMAAMT